MKKNTILIGIIIILSIILFGMFCLMKRPRFALEAKDRLLNMKAFVDVGSSKKCKGLKKSNKEYYVDQKNIEIPILLYHEITKERPERKNYYVHVQKDKFEKQIRGLLKYGYKVIGYQELVDYKEGKIALPEKVLMICFDDGYLGNYNYAFEVAKKYKIPMNIFVVDDLVGTEGYFDWAQAKEMNDSGYMKIYSHGKSHIFYDKLPPKQVVEDINYAHNHIEKELGKTQLKLFTYPYGAYTKEIQTALKESGFMQNLTDDEVNKSEELDLYGMHRIYVFHSYSDCKIIKMITGKNEYKEKQDYKKERRDIK